VLEPSPDFLDRDSAGSPPGIVEYLLLFSHRFTMVTSSKNMLFFSSFSHGYASSNMLFFSSFHHG